jgi:hypothetical protein
VVKISAKARSGMERPRNRSPALLCAGNTGMGEVALKRKWWLV